MKRAADSSVGRFVRRGLNHPNNKYNSGSHKIATYLELNFYLPHNKLLKCFYKHFEKIYIIRGKENVSVEVHIVDFREHNTKNILAINMPTSTISISQKMSAFDLRK